MSEYIPKHLRRYSQGISHCCFSGCTSRGCPAHCCVFEFGHRADCPQNTMRFYDEAEHDIYVASGRRKHLSESE